MRIQTRSNLGGDLEKITLVPESVDDLWHLQFIIDPGDIIMGETDRRIRRKEDISRDTSGQREHMKVTIKNEMAEFHRFSNRIRVSGEIIWCPYEDEIGTNHTLNVEVFSAITIEKKWKSDQIKRIEEAIEAREAPDIVVVTIEEGSAFVQSINQYGIENRAHLTGSTGKGKVSDRTEMFGEILSVLSNIEMDIVLLAGPGFTKENALEYIRSRDGVLAQKITLVEVSSVGERGIQEILSSKTVGDLVTSTRIGKESKIIEEVKKRMKMEGAVVYGIDDVMEAAGYGAVENLLVVDDELREERAGRGLWNTDADKLISIIENKGGKVTILSKEYGPGEELIGLGGIAALLRFNIK